MCEGDALAQGRKKVFAAARVPSTARNQPSPACLFVKGPSTGLLPFASLLLACLPVCWLPGQHAHLGHKVGRLARLGLT